MDNMRRETNGKTDRLHTTWKLIVTFYLQFEFKSKIFFCKSLDLRRDEEEKKTSNTGDG